MKQVNVFWKTFWPCRACGPIQMNSHELDNIPDVRDGLTRKERIVLYCIHELQKERGGRNAPTVMLYGRVIEHINISEQELQLILQRLSNYNQPR